MGMFEEAGVTTKDLSVVTPPLSSAHPAITAGSSKAKNHSNRLAWLSNLFIVFSFRVNSPLLTNAAEPASAANPIPADTLEISPVTVYPSSCLPPSLNVKQICLY